MQRQEELRKLQEQQNQNNMVADGSTAIGWPDNEVQAPPGRLDAVKGALGVGAPGDAAFASRLLNDGQPAATDAVADKAGGQTDGARGRVAGALPAHTARPAMGR